MVYATEKVASAVLHPTLPFSGKVTSATVDRTTSNASQAGVLGARIKTSASQLAHLAPGQCVAIATKSHVLTMTAVTAAAMVHA